MNKIYESLHNISLKNIDEDDSIITLLLNKFKEKRPNLDISTILYDNNGIILTLYKAIKKIENIKRIEKGVKSDNRYIFYMIKIAIWNYKFEYIGSITLRTDRCQVNMEIYMKDVNDTFGESIDIDRTNKEDISKAISSRFNRYGINV